MSTRGCIIAIDTTYKDAVILHITDHDLIHSIYCSDNGIRTDSLPGPGVYLCTLEIKHGHTPGSWLGPEEYDTHMEIVSYCCVYDLKKGVKVSE